MAKGLANPALTIAVAEEFYDNPEILELMAQGHHVVKLLKIAYECDLLLGRNCHYYDETMADYLPVALTAARKRRKERKGKN